MYFHWFCELSSSCMLFLSSFPPPSWRCSAGRCLPSLWKKIWEIQKSVSCFTVILNVVFSGDWKYISREVQQCAVLAGRKAGEGPEEMKTSMRVWAVLDAWRSKARVSMKGRGHPAWGIGQHAAITFLPFTSQFVIYQQVPRKLHKGVGFTKVPPASGVAELRGRRKAGGPSWSLGAVCWPAARTVLGKLSSGVACSQISLIQLLTKQLV